jgi:hypothetical protein
MTANKETVRAVDVGEVYGSHCVFHLGSDHDDATLFVAGHPIELELSYANVCHWASEEAETAAERMDALRIEAGEILRRLGDTQPAECVQALVGVRGEPDDNSVQLRGPRTAAQIAEARKHGHYIQLVEAAGPSAADAICARAQD